MSYYNPFASAELVYPGKYRDHVETFTQTQPSGGEKPSPDRSPFPRVVDLWFLAMCLGFFRGRRETVEDPHKFITGEILARDPWRIELLEMIALHEKRTGDALVTPSETVVAANEYAAGGIGELLDLVGNDSAQQPIWNLTEGLTKLASSLAGGAPPSAAATLGD